MKRITTVIILLVITSSKLVASGLDSSDYVLYSKVINNYLKEHKLKNGNKIFITGTSDFRNTYSDYMKDPYKIPCFSCSVFYPGNKPTKVDTSFVTLWVKLDSINQQPVEFDNKFKIRKYKPIIIDSTFNDSYSTVQGFDWSTFYKKNPRSVGIVTLSKIAYSDNGRYALLYLAYQYHGLGAVAKILLIDIEQDYKIIRDEVMWES